MSLKQTINRYELFDNKEFQLVAKVEAELLTGARKWLSEYGFTEIIVPRLVNATGSCEIIDTLFKVPYFGKEAFLSQTGQLYLEAVVPFFGGKVWTFGPSFRAERRVDDRHLTEFSLLELEFEGDFEHLLEVIEKLLAGMLRQLSFIHVPEIRLPFKRLKYEDAISKLGLKFGFDLTSVDEQKLVAENNQQPMFITHFPKDLKYFNMRVNDDDDRVVNSADLLLPYAGESAGAAEREFNPAKLQQRLHASAMWRQFVANGGDESAFDWYMNAYWKYPYKLHSGFGMGLNRVTKYVLQADDIRATTVYPTNAETIY